MFLIVGLGNPTKKYEKTRHNMGFDCIDVLAKKLGVSVTRPASRALTGKCRYNGHELLLAKPQTFMNLSGESVKALLRYYKIKPEELIVIYDDTDLDVGKIRVRASGSPGSHNGMKNIQALLGGGDFPRVRIGIGKRPEFMDMVDFVLGHFSKEERGAVDTAIENAADAVLDIIDSGTAHAMNKYN